LKYLFDDWRTINRKLSKSSQIVLLLDYDGTLTPIVDRPELAVLAGSTRGVLKKLAKCKRFKLAVVSGRNIKELKKLVKLRGIYYAGNHGLEAIGPSFYFIHPRVEGLKNTSWLVHYSLKNAFRDIQGVIIENKTYSLTLHYRMVPVAKRKEIIKRFMAVVKPFLGNMGFRIFKNKMSLELMPDTKWDKGNIIRILLREITSNKLGVQVIFVGDDNTDEDAFKALKDIGATILVGKRKSQAKYYVKDVPGVIRFLNRLHAYQSNKRLIQEC
jgi:trehalose 6-phosphate phosphatase